VSTARWWYLRMHGTSFSALMEHINLDPACLRERLVTVLQEADGVWVAIFEHQKVLSDSTLTLRRIVDGT
jgi:hypothetical protein